MTFHDDDPVQFLHYAARDFMAACELLADPKEAVAEFIHRLVHISVVCRLEPYDIHRLAAELMRELRQDIIASL